MVKKFNILDIEVIIGYLKTNKQYIDKAVKKNALKFELGIDFKLCKLKPEKDIDMHIDKISNNFYVFVTHNDKIGECFCEYSFVENDFMDLLK